LYRAKFFEKLEQTRNSSPGRRQAGQPVGVLAQTEAEALIREIDDRQQLPLDDDLADGGPRLRVRIDAARVVA